MDDEKIMDRFQTHLDNLTDDTIDLKRKLEGITPILVFLAVGLIATFAASAYYAEKTNERLLRLEKIVQIDEIGRRK